MGITESYASSPSMSSKLGIHCHSLGALYAV